MAFKVTSRQPKIGERLPDGRIKLRWAHEGKGCVLQGRDGMVYVPYEWDGKYWSVVVVLPPRDERWACAYPRGGYNVIISNDDVMCDSEIIIRRLPGADEGEG